MTRDADRKADPMRGALEIIEALRAAGHVAYLAGGCVRDRLLGRQPKDYDVATDAPPSKVKALFPRARQVGAKFGVILVRKFRRDIEVATFRSDGAYSDGRHPDAVTFGTDREDALRRDFTINGMFLDPLTDRVIDYVGGQEDLRAGVIRTIGDPDRRFEEDHLRLLRAVRFAARLGFPLDSATRDAVIRHAEHLRRISAERIWRELELILTEPTRSAGWRLMNETGLRPHLATHWTPDTALDHAAEKRLAVLPEVVVDPALALSAALLGRPASEARMVCGDLRLSNKLSRAVVWLVESAALVRTPDDFELADLKTMMARPAWPNLPELLRADLLASGQSLAEYHRLMARAAAIPLESVAPPPLLNGDELAALGIAAGPEMGTAVRALYRAQLNEEISTREQAIAFIRDHHVK